MLTVIVLTDVVERYDDLLIEDGDEIGWRWPQVSLRIAWSLSGCVVVDDPPAVDAAAVIAVKAMSGRRAVMWLREDCQKSAIELSPCGTFFVLHGGPRSSAGERRTLPFRGAGYTDETNVSSGGSRIKL